MKSMVRFVAVLAAACCFLATPVFGQGSPNVTLLAHVNSYPSAGYNDCWGYTAPDGREYALLGVQNGTSILDITDTDNVVEIAFIPSNTSSWRDIKTYLHYAYVVNESGGGLQIIDLSDLPNSATLVATDFDITTSHNIYIDEDSGTLFAEGSFGEPVKIFSLANPLDAVWQSSLGIECHDVYAQDGRLYVSEGSSGTFGIYDVADPANPQLLERLPVPAAGYCHNAWTTEDGNFMMTTEETTGKTLKMWDITDLSNITLLDEIIGPSGLAHNAHIKGDYSYVSHYADGLRIYNIADPADVFEEGFYDTYTGGGGGFVGAWGAYPFFRTGKVLISDISTGLYVVYFLGALEDDLFDPQPPTELSVYSDHNTPNGMILNWTDPLQLVNGDTIAPGDFTIEIERDSVLVASVPGGQQNYIDSGLNDGQYYEYNIFARIIADDSTSTGIGGGWIAGGAATPASPQDFACSNSTTEAFLTWTDPDSQVDDTPLDDLLEIQVFRDGVQIAAVAPGVESYTDIPPVPGFIYDYYIQAVDNESPQNASAPTIELNCWVGGTPDFLVWVGPDAAGTSAASGDSLFETLVGLGESTFITNDLFEFGTDLSIYQAVFVVLGIFGDNHVLDEAGAEGPALEAYLLAGGNVFLEGGDCFNYDPELGGYNIRPWFGIDDGSDGSADMFGIDGLNDLSDFAFSYSGLNNWMDDLVVLDGTPLWQNDINVDISGVYHDGFGSGRAIGVVPSFGGFDNNNARKAQPQAPVYTDKQMVPRGTPAIIEKRGAHFPERKAERKAAAELLRNGDGGYEILANNKADLMAAYLALFGLADDPDKTVTIDITIDIGSVPAAGDTFAYDLTVSNLTTEQQQPDFWIEMTLPNGNVLPTLMPRSPLLPPQGVLSRSPLIRVSENGPAGTYTVTAYLGTYPSDTTCVDVATFEKSATVASGSLASLEAVPQHMELQENYPNPFNPQTTIRYALNSDAQVTIEVYNTLGQRIATLVDQWQNAGYKSIDWHGQDDQGRPVASGIYIYRMRAVSQTPDGRGEFTATQKMLLAR